MSPLVIADADKTIKKLSTICMRLRRKAARRPHGVRSPSNTMIPRMFAGHLAVDVFKQTTAEGTGTTFQNIDCSADYHHEDMKGVLPGAGSHEKIEKKQGKGQHDDQNVDGLCCKSPEEMRKLIFC